MAIKEPWDDPCYQPSVELNMAIKAAFAAERKAMARTYRRLRVKHPSVARLVFRQLQNAKREKFAKIVRHYETVGMM